MTLEEGKVGLYACGITPYSPSHIGHARQAISFDIIVRWLRKRGFEVNYITNFTDVDDKIIAAANEEGVDFLEISNRYIDDYFESMDALNVIRADSYPRVTETIPEIIEMVESLIEKGNAYLAEDGVYFEIDTSPEKYGQLTGQTLEMVRSGAGGRVGKTGSGKRDHRDFALWKMAKPGEPWWESPWGKGRPGWHIECSAMSLKHLGEKFDIHGGGSDLIFPHHEAEIFQSECCLGHDPVGAVLDPQWNGQCRWRENEQVTGELLDNLGGVEECRPPGIEIHPYQRPIPSASRLQPGNDR